MEAGAVSWSPCVWAWTFFRRGRGCGGGVFVLVFNFHGGEREQRDELYAAARDPHSLCDRRNWLGSLLQGQRLRDLRVVDVHRSGDRAVEIPQSSFSTRADFSLQPMGLSAGGHQHCDVGAGVSKPSWHIDSVYYRGGDLS